MEKVKKVIIKKIRKRSSAQKILMFDFKKGISVINPYRITDKQSTYYSEKQINLSLW